MKVAPTRAIAAARRSSRTQLQRALSTHTDVDNHAFVHGMSKEQARKALDRHAAIRADHHAAKRDFLSSSQGEHEVDADEANHKRVIYRSKQRGWLEVDLLLGRWASQNVMQLSSEELREYEDILNEETIDIFNYISGKDPHVPARVDTPMMKRLQTYCLSSPLGKASVEGFAQNKKFMSN
uniref:Succinate dehydrogenase assembly factor 2, mitochondrial n=1 Tax=Peronospora matthiolae TaxID=2874970 RepID=A0AAV1UK48_9STRA